MIKRKYIVWLLILTFLNLLIAPDFVFAKSYKGDYPDLSDLFDDSHEKDKTKAIVLTSLGVIAVGLIIYLIVKSKKSQQKELKELKKLSQDSKGSPSKDNELLATSGDVAVLRW